MSENGNKENGNKEETKPDPAELKKANERLDQIIKKGEDLIKDKTELNKLYGEFKKTVQLIKEVVATEYVKRTDLIEKYIQEGETILDEKKDEIGDTLDKTEEQIEDPKYQEALKAIVKEKVFVEKMVEKYKPKIETFLEEQSSVIDSAIKGEKVDTNELMNSDLFKSMKSDTSIIIKVSTLAPKIASIAAVIGLSDTNFSMADMAGKLADSMDDSTRLGKISKGAMKMFSSIAAAVSITDDEATKTLKELLETLTKQVESFNDEIIINNVLNTFSKVNQSPMKDIASPTVFRVYDDLCRKLLSRHKNNYVYFEAILADLLNDNEVRKLFTNVVNDVRKNKKFVIQIAPGECNCSPEQMLERNKQYLINIQSKYFVVILAQLRLAIMNKIKGGNSTMSTGQKGGWFSFFGSKKKEGNVVNPESDNFSMADIYQYDDGVVETNNPMNKVKKVPSAKNPEQKLDSEAFIKKKLMEAFDVENVDAKTRQHNVTIYPKLLLEYADIKDTMGLNDILTSVMREMVYMMDDPTERDNGDKSRVLQQIVIDEENNETAVRCLINLARNFISNHKDSRIKMIILLNLLQDSRAINTVFQYMKKAEYPTKKIVAENFFKDDPPLHEIDINPRPLVLSGGAKSIIPVKKRKVTRRKINPNQAKKSTTRRKKPVPTKIEEVKYIGGATLGTDARGAVAGVANSMVGDFDAMCNSEKVKYILDTVTSSLQFKIMNLDETELAKKIAEVFKEVYTAPTIEGIHPVVNLEFDACLRNMVDKCYRGEFSLMNYMMCEILNDTEIRGICLLAKKNVDKEYSHPVTIPKKDCDCDGLDTSTTVKKDRTPPLRTYYQIIMREFLSLLGKVEDIPISDSSKIKESSTIDKTKPENSVESKPDNSVEPNIDNSVESKPDNSVDKNLDNSISDDSVNNKQETVKNDNSNKEEIIGGADEEGQKEDGRSWMYRLMSGEMEKSALTAIPKIQQQIKMKIRAVAESKTMEDLLKSIIKGEDIIKHEESIEDKKEKKVEIDPDVDALNEQEEIYPDVDALNEQEEIYPDVDELYEEQDPYVDPAYVEEASFSYHDTNIFTRDAQRGGAKLDENVHQQRVKQLLQSIEKESKVFTLQNKKAILLHLFTNKTVQLAFEINMTEGYLSNDANYKLNSLSIFNKKISGGSKTRRKKTTIVEKKDNKHKKYKKQKKGKKEKTDNKKKEMRKTAKFRK